MKLFSRCSTFTSGLITCQFSQSLQIFRPRFPFLQLSNIFTENLNLLTSLSQSPRSKESHFLFFRVVILSHTSTILAFAACTWKIRFLNIQKHIFFSELLNQLRLDQSRTSVSASSPSRQDIASPRVFSTAMHLQRWEDGIKVHLSDIFKRQWIQGGSFFTGPP